MKRIYGIVGDSLNGLTDAIRLHGKIEWVQVRHEEVAAFAAGAEAHLTGELAICAGSRGPAAPCVVFYGSRVDAVVGYYLPPMRYLTTDRRSTPNIFGISRPRPVRPSKARSVLLFEAGERSRICGFRHRNQ